MKSVEEKSESTGGKSENLWDHIIIEDMLKVKISYLMIKVYMYLKFSILIQCCKRSKNEMNPFHDCEYI